MAVLKKTPKVAAVKFVEFRVDLKWSLWSKHVDHWQEYAPGILSKIAAALNRGQTVVVYTASKKEIRFGKVEIRFEKRRFHAEVSFACEWDDVPCLMDTLDQPEETRDSFEEICPRNESGDPGYSVWENVSAASFPRLLAEIDKVEDRLLVEDRSEWKDLCCSFFKREVAIKKGLFEAPRVVEILVDHPDWEDRCKVLTGFIETLGPKGVLKLEAYVAEQKETDAALAKVDVPAPKKRGKK